MSDSIAIAAGIASLVASGIYIFGSPSGNNNNNNNWTPLKEENPYYKPTEQIGKHGTFITGNDVKRPTTFIDNVNSFTGVDIKDWRNQLEYALVKRLNKLQETGLVKTENNNPLTFTDMMSDLNPKGSINLNDMINSSTFWKDGETKNAFMSSPDFVAFQSLNSDHFKQDIKTLNDLTFWNPQEGKTGMVGPRQVPQTEYNKSLYAQFIVDNPNIEHALKNIGVAIDESLKAGINVEGVVLPEYESAKTLYKWQKQIGQVWNEGLKPVGSTNQDKTKDNNDSWWMYFFGGDPNNGVVLGTWDDFLKGLMDGFLFIPKHLAPPGDNSLYVYLIIGGVVLIGTIHLINKI